MSLRSGFFPSKKDGAGNGDRKYSAKDFGAIFDGVIPDGIFHYYGDAFLCTSNGGRTIKIGTGRGWFLHTWVWNETPDYLNISTAEPNMNRTDSIILKIDRRYSVRNAEFYVLRGEPKDQTEPTPAALPESTTNVTYVRLARVIVRKGVSDIAASDVRPSYEGASWIESHLKTVDITNLINTWNTRFNENVTVWSNRAQELYNNWNDTFSERLTTINTRFQILYDDWSNSLQTLHSHWQTRLQELYDYYEPKLRELHNQFDSFIYDSDRTFNSFMTRIEAAFDAFEQQKQEEIDEMLAHLGDEFSVFWTEFKALMNSYLSEQETIWSNWFTHIQDQLDEDAAGHLQNQIDAITYIYVYDNELVIPGTTASVSGSELILGNPSIYAPIPAFNVNTASGHLEYSSNADFVVNENSGHAEWDIN